MIINAAVKDRIWPHLSERPGWASLRSGAVLEPLRKLYSSKAKGLPKEAKQKLLYAVTGGIWTQTKAVQFHLADQQYCMACQAPKTTVRHLAWQCGINAHLRHQADFGERALGAASSDEEHHVWSHALIPCPLWKAPLPLRRRTIRRGGDVAGDAFSGTCYSDGSLLWPQHDMLRRGGWGFVMAGEGLQPCQWAYGPLVEPVHDSFIAEIIAVLELLAVAVPPLRIMVDNANLARGFEAGPLWARRAGIARHYGEYWRRFWDEVHGFGPLEIIWIPSHTTEADVQRGRISMRDRVYNGRADEMAKKGAAMHPSCEQSNAAWREAAVRARELGWFIGKALANANAVLQHPRASEGSAGVVAGSAGIGVPAAVATTAASAAVVPVASSGAVDRDPNAVAPDACDADVGDGGRHDGSRVRAPPRPASSGSADVGAGAAMAAALAGVALAHGLGGDDGRERRPVEVPPAAAGLLAGAAAGCSGSSVGAAGVGVPALGTAAAASSSVAAAVGSGDVDRDPNAGHRLEQALDGSWGCTMCF